MLVVAVTASYPGGPRAWRHAFPSSRSASQEQVLWTGAFVTRHWSVVLVNQSAFIIKASGNKVNNFMEGFKLSLE